MIAEAVMKVGDLVRWNEKVCVVTEIYESKCWRTNQHGAKINWASIETEPFVRILVGDGDVRGVPQADIEVISESRG